MDRRLSASRWADAGVAGAPTRTSAAGGRGIIASMKVLLYGSTGYTGSNIARELVARGHEVTGVARTSDAEAADGVRPVAGSVFDADLLAREAEGADAIVVAVTQHGERDLGEAVPALLAEAERADARLGIVGGASSLLDRPGGTRLIDGDFPDEWRPEAEAGVAVLDALRESGSGADWFFVSPPMVYGSFAAGERRGSYRVGGDVLLVDDEGTSTIGGEDFAIALVDELETPAHHRERFTVAY
jgi:uncharacterized protein